MDANEDYLDSLLNSVLSQESGGGDGNAQQNNGSEAELEEINDLLKKSDQNQMPDAEMLAMLERAESEKPAEGSDNDVPDVFDIFSSESIGAEENQVKRSDGMQAASDKEAYLDALLNGTADDMAATDGQSEKEQTSSEVLSDGEDFLSLDSLQTEEEPSPADETSGGGEDFLSLDSLQTEEEPLPTDEVSDGGEDFLSLDSLQTEEEPLPTDEVSGGGEDFLSLDSLQTEEEPSPTDEVSGGEEDFLSLDSLQTEEEPSPTDEVSGGEEDFLSLDSLQSEEAPAADGGFSDGEGMLSLDSLQNEEDMDYESSAEEDAEIQREIDELLGLAGSNDAEEPVQDSGAAESSFTEDAGNKAEAPDSPKKEKKKKRFGKKKGKESAESVPSMSEAGVPAAMENAGQNRENVGISNNVPDGEMTADILSSSAQKPETPGAASEGKKKKAKGRKEKVKKQKAVADSGNEQKEPGFFARMLNGLLEEADEEEEQPLEMEVSDENREIMAMMDNEKIENKKPGSKKAKKGKKGKAEANQDGDADGDEEAPVDEKKAKKEKKKKEKKEKKEQKKKAKQEKEQEEKAVPVKKLPRGKVFSVFAFCLTLLAVIVILCFLLPQQRDLKIAREAYYDHDYLTVYQNMDGKDLSDSDYILYMRSRMILNMQGKLDNYLVYMGMDKEMAALNELMLAVHYYQSNRSAAEGYGALEEMNTVYEQVLSVLSQQYRLSETEAIEIFALDDLSYNERLYYLVHGTEFIAPGVPQGGTSDSMGSIQTGASGDEALNDVLPEENEMISGDQPQGSMNDMPGNGSDTGAAGMPGDWQGNVGSEDLPSGEGAGDQGMDPYDGQPAGTDSGNQPEGVGQEAASNGNSGDFVQDGAGENFGPSAGGESQPQNTPGESLSQGNGDVLYSGEVQNGNAVLQ